MVVDAHRHRQPALLPRSPVPSTLRTLTTDNSARASSRYPRCRQSGDVPPRSNTNWRVKAVWQLERFRNYCGLIKVARSGFPWEKTTKGDVALVYTNCETAVLWPDGDRKEWFSLDENQQKLLDFGLHQLRNRCSPKQRTFCRTGGANWSASPIARQQQRARGVVFPGGKATGKKAAPESISRRFAPAVHQPPGAATPGGEVSCSGF